VPTLEKELLEEDPAVLAKAAREQGEASRGAILFYQQHTTCTKCHAFGEEESLLGPDLTKPDPAKSGKKPTDVFLVESILNPSKEIRKGFEPVIVVTDEGLTITGLLAEDLPDRLVLRDPAKDGELVTIKKDEIDDQAESPQSIMTPALTNQLANRQQFLDLVRYVMEVTEGGLPRARELEPDPSLYAPPPLPEYENHVDHAGMIAGLNQESYNRGREIYERLCINCHGTKDEPGSLPTSLRFASDAFRNGNDPHSMYKTLTHGFGLMVPQTWMVPQQKYDAVHYIREEYLKKHNTKQYVAVDDTYLARLPKGDTKGPAPSKFEAWVAMDYGPNLTASYEVGTNASNFAYKGNAIRLDPGPGGVTRGGYWMIFDEDTLRIAAAWSGEQFIDYNAIMLNGKHAIHPRIVGQLHFENKTGPGWANPETGSFEDPRFLGRDDRPYGPLPRPWAQYKGLYHHNHHVIVSYTVGDTPVLEMPGVDTKSTTPVFTRTFEMGPRRRDMILQVAEQPGSESGLHDMAGIQGAVGQLAVFGPGGALVEEEPVVADAPTPKEEPGQTAALAFDGATHVTVAKPDDFKMAGADYTVSARIKTKADGTIFCKTSPSGNWAHGGQTFFINGGKLALDVGFVGVVRARTRVNDGRWHEVAMTYEQADNRIRLYLDGKLDGEGRLEPLGKDRGFPVLLGYTSSNFPGHPFLDGQMSDVCFHQRALSEDEIAKMTAGNRPAKGLLACWRPDSVTGKTVADATKGGHDGQVVKGTPAPKALPTAPAAAKGGLVVAGVSQPIEGLRWLATEEGQLCLVIPAGNKPLRFTLSIARTEKADQIVALAEQLRGDESAVDLTALTHGGPPRWIDKLKTEGVVAKDEGPFATDVLTHPATNPWFCRMRLTGFDFMPDGNRAAVCSWGGNVWMVTGIERPEEGLTWQRIASGMFQPLGVKCVDGKIYISCRDQIAILHDLNGDGETDYYECFNNDHQVTEHFHEFVMGLQADAEGNFYYAKSARHARTALVPHHGTLLKVTKDGQRTEILAKGFRAANGVCINPDGSFMVTDQEGHWNPKNRINWVIPNSGAFYGNMYGYHDVTDPSDEAMDQPLCWITNSFDRSPAELIWVTSDKWGPLKGSLLNTSYGYGMVYVVPFEKVDGQVQGGMNRLPIPMFATGVMRPRFHPTNGQLYLAGMFAWAGSRNQPGGFYRLRYTGKPVHLPVGINATTEGVRLTFSGELDPETAENPANYNVKVWGLKRTASYGSPHVNEHPLEVSRVDLSADGKTVLIHMPDIAPTWCMEIRYRLQGIGGERIDSMIHNSIYNLGPPKRP